jgi:hypothetical protein
MLTANPCSDAGADDVCQSVVDMAASLSHDGLIEVERMQQRGTTAIDRPHVHWVANMSKEKVEGIARELRAKGLDVKVTPVWSANGLCYYLGKDPNGRFYMVKEEDFTTTGTPSAPSGGQEAGIPVPEQRKDEGTSEERHPPPLWAFLKDCVTKLFGYIGPDVLSTRPPMVGMTRAP